MKSWIATQPTRHVQTSRAQGFELNAMRIYIYGCQVEAVLFFVMRLTEHSSPVGCHTFSLLLFAYNFVQYVYIGCPNDFIYVITAI